jgi:hypothetical protein
MKGELIFYHKCCAVKTFLPWFKIIFMAYFMVSKENIFFGRNAQVSLFFYSEFEVKFN